MNIQFIKGLLLLLTVIAAVFALVVMFSDAGPAKASCVVRAIAAHVSLGNIDQVCELTTHAH